MSFASPVRQDERERGDRRRSRGRKGHGHVEAVLTQAINRLESVLAGESLALRSGDSASLSDISNRKNQSLFELTRLQRGIEPASLSAEMRERLGTLRENLTENSRLLQIHIEATAEVADVITRAITAAESDGTYGASLSGARVAK